MRLPKWLPLNYVDDYYAETNDLWDKDFDRFMRYVAIRTNLDLIAEIQKLREESKK